MGNIELLVETINNLLVNTNFQILIHGDFFNTIDESTSNNDKYVSRSSFSEDKSLNDFILEALQISEDKRKLSLKTQCPNGLEVYPSIKMKFENYGSPLLGDKLEAMMITWRDGF